MTKLIIFIFLALVIIILLKSIKSVLPLYLTIFVIATVCISSFVSIMPTVEFINTLSDRINIEDRYLKIIIKCISVCFLCSVCTNICKDCGESSLAFAAEVVCRFSMISLTLPIYIDIFNWIIKLWGIV